MNDEIKEILDSLNKIAKAEYYPEDLLTYKECIMLLEYIEDLQDYKSRCEKATELIEKSRVKATPFFKQFDGDLIMPKREVDKLLNLLNGGDEE